MQRCLYNLYFIKNKTTFFVTVILLLTPISLLSGQKQCDFVDVYGTNLITSELICELFYEDINKLRHWAASEDIDTITKFLKLNDSIADRLKSMGPFSEVSVSPIVYLNRQVFITIDFLEIKDKQIRTGFYAEPQETISGTDTLLEQWMKYAREVHHLFATNPKSLNFSSCPGFHCLGGFEHPLLVEYGKIFVRDVPTQTDALIKVLRRDKDPFKRASAVYLLAYTNDLNVLIKALVPSIRDPNSLVRNNVMRVLSVALLMPKGINEHLPLTEIVAALNFPSVSDRNNALCIVWSLSQHKTYAEYFTKHAGIRLVTLLKMKQPNIHDISYDILKRFSGKDYDERNYGAWDKWAKDAAG